jgi:hypothetical protein
MSRTEEEKSYDKNPSKSYRKGKIRKNGFRK